MSNVIPFNSITKHDLDPDMGGAPCEEMDEEDVFGPEEPDPDYLREDRDERKQLEKEAGE